MLTVTPGMKTSEFLLAILNVIGMIVADAQNYVTNTQAATLSVGGLVAYIVSRGLAKTEPRPPGGTGSE